MASLSQLLPEPLTMPERRPMVLEPEKAAHDREIERAIRKTMRAMRAYQAACDRLWKDRVAKAYGAPRCPS